MDSPTDIGQRFTAHWTEAQPIVSSFLYGSVRHWHDAEDLLQQVAASAYRGYSDFDASRPFLPWVMAIARNAVVDHLRRSGRDALVFDETTLATIARVHESIAPEAGPRREALSHCMQRIADKPRRILDLRYQENVSVNRIADDLGMTPNAVSLVLYKARKSLADCIRARLAEEDAR